MRDSSVHVVLIFKKEKIPNAEGKVSFQISDYWYSLQCIKQ